MQRALIIKGELGVRKKKDLTFDEARVHAHTHDSFEDLAQDIAITEAAVAIDRKCRVVRNLVVQIKPAEPPIRKVKCNLLAKPPLETHAVAVADDQHPGS